MMTRQKRSVGRTSHRALARFTVLWLLAGTAAAVALVVILDRTGVSLPPLRESRLGIAAREGGCLVRSAVPAVDSTGAVPARPGSYADPPADASLVEARRRGIIVIRHRADLPEDRVAQLEILRRRMPVQTIVVSDPSAPDLLRVEAWRRVLVCTDVTGTTLDAIRLFEARNLGRAPLMG